MRDDTPDDVVHELFADAALFPGHPLGREVLGIAATRSPRCRATRSPSTTPRTTSPSNVVVAAAGNLDHDEVVEQVDRRVPLDGASARPRPRRPRRSRRPSSVAARAPRRPSRPTSCSALRARRARRPRPLRARRSSNQVLGGGMSSRLFQEVREQRGLAYSVYSYRSRVRGDRRRSRSTPAPRRSASHETLDVVGAELDRLVADGGVAERELVGGQGPPQGLDWRSRSRARSSRMHRSAAAS